MNKKIFSAIIAGIMTFSVIPTAVSAESLSEIKGDVNSDGEFNVSDLVLVQKWLLNDSIKLENWKMGDFCEDGVLDSFDLCLMRNELIGKKTEIQGRKIEVSNIEELFVAARNAQPGDTILAAPGTYDYTTYQGAQKIDTSAEGTKEAPIILTAADPENPPVITGTTAENGYVLQITGDYWIVENLIITTSQKGIVLDNSNHTIIRNCDIGNTGSEAVALRDGSSYCLVQNCNIHDSGLITPGYGEGVYIGSSYTVTGFDYKCDNNTVDGCTFKNIAAEHVDVKEFTTGTEIFNCTFYGDGMSGQNFAGSFIDIAGNGCYVHDNIGYRNNNPQIVAAFEIHDQADGWGYHNRFENNTLYMDREYGEIDTSRRMYVVDGWFSDFTVKNNLVDYGNGLEKALPEYYNSDYVTFED
ncbi:MAG: right-handed parallel beta-helix repeat-containing protein [Ruminococcus sp.]|nr:right-handed parallel beta-helix repeat-containing protein [Ruminococcus sp.]